MNSRVGGVDEYDYLGVCSVFPWHRMNNVAQKYSPRMAWSGSERWDWTG